MAAVNLHIPNEIVDRLRLPPGRAEEELRREFAVFLVKEGLLNRSQARQIAQMERLAFEDLLAQQKVPWEGTAEDALEDMEAAKAARRRPNGQ